MYFNLDEAYGLQIPCPFALSFIILESRLIKVLSMTEQGKIWGCVSFFPFLSCVIRQTYRRIYDGWLGRFLDGDILEKKIDNISLHKLCIQPHLPSASCRG